MLAREPLYIYRRLVNYNPSAHDERVYPLPVDAYATDDTIVLTAAVPGMAANALSITLDGDILTICGEVNGHVENARCLLRERPHGKFERRLTVNVPVNVKAARATVKNGVLTLVLPKAEAAYPHHVVVKVVE
ncbi:MAG: Hsp20/alpha crystallin family protein [Aggregatilineales bacterium]